MNLKPHIWLVNSHSESDGRDNVINFLHQTHILVFGAGFGSEAGVIWNGFDSIYLQELGKFFHTFSAQAIDDTRFSGILMNEFHDFFVLVDFWSDFIK